MAAQIPDEYIFDGESFSLVGLKVEGVFIPEDLDLKPYFTCTACWQGYVIRYIFINNQFILDGILVNSINPPKIEGAEPESGNNLFEYCYKNLNLKTKFTRVVLLAKDII